MKRLPLLLFFTSSLLCFNSLFCFSQTANSLPKAQATLPENFENIYLHWSIAEDKARIENGIPPSDFDCFTRFFEKGLDSLRGDFIKHIGNKTITTANVGKYEGVLINSILSLYTKYRAIAKAYPSSVEQYRNTALAKRLTAGPCDSACNNINFETGNLSGWNTYYAFNNSSTTASIFTNITGGPAGAVAHSANDTLTSTPGYYNPSVGPNHRPDYQINITSGNRGDAIVPSIPVVSPFGGKYSVMVGDSSQVGYGVAILSQTFLVGPSNENFTYQYAVFLENANPPHQYYQQPFFIIALLDQNGDTIPICGNYKVVSGHGTQSFDSTSFYDSAVGGDLPVYYKDWTIVDIPLKRYVGQCVTIIFETGDCSLGGHFGYAYVDASCSPIGVISSSPNFCGQDSISLSAPPGGNNYIWTGPGIIGSPTTQTIGVDKPGIYRVIVVPVTGVACADTLYDTIGKIPGPPPKPDFRATIACAGQPMHFINLSSDTSTASFYWDFYNIGVYNDTNIIDPTWLYNNPGTYTVKLDEVYKGCGVDTLITVQVVPPVSGGFTANNACAGTPVTATSNIIGATNYLWNYGDPASGANNTSSGVNGSHTYAKGGTYTITLIAGNSGTCPDTAKQVITIYPAPNAIITGLDSVCPNYADTLRATGGATYLWSTGATTSSIIVASATTQIITVTVYDSNCSESIAFTVHRISPEPVIKASSYLVCKGDQVTLTAGGGTTYRWSTNSTATTIVVKLTVPTTYTLYATTGNCTDSTTVFIGIETPPLLAPILNQSICPNNDATLMANVVSGFNGTFLWQPGGSTQPSITVSPAKTTSYTVQYTNACGTTQDTVTVFVSPVPLPAFSASITQGCAPLCVQFRYINLRQFDEIANMWSWTFGNGTVVNEENPIYCYPDTGTFSPSLTVTYNNGCSTTLLVDGMIKVFSKPIANFIASPQPANILAPTIQFTDQTTDAYGITWWNWTYGDATDSMGINKNAVHTYRDTGTYCPQLVVQNQRGCFDTVTNCLVIDPIFTLYIPSAFSPNGDGWNETFEPKGVYVKTFEMYIFDRWGMELYHTTDLYKGWNGTVNGGTTISQEDCYVYKITATDWRNIQHSYIGVFTLIK